MTDPSGAGLEPRGPGEAGVRVERAVGGEPGVLTVFSSPFCGPCERMKGWLTEREYPFVVRDVLMDEEAGELLEANDIRTTPALLVGDTFVVGFDVAAMERTLAGWSP